MAVFVRDRILAAWVALIAATLVAWGLGTDHGVDDPALASTIILLIAFLKVRFVGRYFMELRDAPVVLLGIFEGWVAAVCIGVVTMYLAT